MLDDAPRQIAPEAVDSRAYEASPATPQEDSCNPCEPHAPQPPISKAARRRRAANRRLPASPTAARTCATLTQPDTPTREAAPAPETGAVPSDGGTPSAAPSPVPSIVRRETSVPPHGAQRLSWEGPFLLALATRGNVAEACRAAGRSRATVYEHRERWPDFAAAWKECQETAWDRMEAELYRRGVEGYDQPVFFGGEQVGTRKEYDSALLLAGLKAHRPEYRDRVDLTHAAPDGGPVRTAAEVTVQLAPYQEAVRMMVEGIFAERALDRPAQAALPAPTGPEVIDVTPEASAGRPCPRCDGPGVNPYCAECHGAGVTAFPQG